MSGVPDRKDGFGLPYNYGGVNAGFGGVYKGLPSPYLNYDPSYLPQTQPEFIFLDSAKKQRGRFELAFGQIGGSVMVGAACGGVTGFYHGLKFTTLAGQTGKLRRTQLLNQIMKSGSGAANACGTVAVLYSAFGVILSWTRGTDDDINTIVAATTTGFLYKSTAGLKACGIGGAVGLGASLLYALWNNKDKVTSIRQFNAA